MKLIFKFLIIACFLLNSMSCRTLFKSKHKKSEEAQVEVSNFGISFISIGGGIDQKAKDKFLKYIDNFEKDNVKSIVISSSTWGREGEIDYCIKFLNGNLQSKFISDVKDLLKDSSLVRYKESCTSK